MLFPGGISVERIKLWKRELKKTTVAGFEPARTKYNGLAIHRLNHSATLSTVLLYAGGLFIKALLKGPHPIFSESSRNNLRDKQSNKKDDAMYR